MASLRVIEFLRQREAAFGLAGVLLLVGLLAMMLLTGGIPTARADSPVLTASTGTTNPGGEVDISGTGWAPAKHYYLYVYGQSKCSPNPICPPPSPSDPYLINPNSSKIDNDGNLSEFTFKFKPSTNATTFVFTVVTTDTNVSQSVLVQVVPVGTPPSGTPVSSSPTATPTSVATTITASPTSASQTGGGSQSTGTGGGNTLAIVVVTVLLLIAIAVLTGLLIVLPPKRRAIRAAWYGMSGTGSTGGRSYGYGASGPMASGPRRASGGYAPMDEPEPPAWMGGVAQWGDDQPRAPRSRPGPRRPTGGEY